MRRVVAILALLATAALVFFGQGAGGSGGDYQVRAIFDNGNFLVPGEAVRVAGATVVSVASTDVTMPGDWVHRGGKPEPGKAAVVLSITDSSFQDFRRDASCLIRPQSLLGEKYIDQLLSLAIAALIAYGAVGIARETSNLLMEGTPRGVDLPAVAHAITATRMVTGVHDLHVWALTSGFPALSAHVVVGRGEDCHDARARLAGVLHERFDIDHVTLQVEHEQGLISIEPRP